MSYADFFKRATRTEEQPDGLKPFPYQCRLAEKPCVCSPQPKPFKDLPISAPVVRRSEPNAPAPLPAELVLHLTWTHLTDFVRMEDPCKRAYYETECLKGNWWTQLMNDARSWRPQEKAECWIANSKL